MTSSVELQILQAALSIIVLLVGGLISAFVPKLKKTIDTHLGLRQAAIAKHVVDGLAQIAEAVVSDFNQRVVADAKENGVFTPQLASSIKADAIEAVLQQGATLAQLGEDVLGDMRSLVSTLVEQAVLKQHG
jgi:hypothetical protein